MINKQRYWARQALAVINALPSGHDKKKFLTDARQLPMLISKLEVLNAFVMCMKNKDPKIAEAFGGFIKHTMGYSTNEKIIDKLVAFNDIHSHFYLLEECLGFASQLKLYAEINFKDL